MLVFDNYRKGYQSDKRKGPFKIEKVLSNDNYLIYDHLLASWKKYNASKLKLFIPSPDVQPEPVLVPEVEPVVREIAELPQPLPIVALEPVEKLVVAEKPLLDPIGPAVVVEPLKSPKLPVARVLRPTLEASPPKYALRSRVNLPGTANDYRYRPNSYEPRGKW